MKQNLGDILTRDPGGVRIIKMLEVHMVYGNLILFAATSAFCGGRSFVLAEIVCSRAIDYSIRPPRPSAMEGGPSIEYFGRHPLLESQHLNYVPGGDGEYFCLPEKWKLLLFDQSYVIAEKFEISESSKRV